MLNYLPERIYSEFENDEMFASLTENARYECFGDVDSGTDLLEAYNKYETFNNKGVAELIDYIKDKCSEEHKIELDLFLNNGEKKFDLDEEFNKLDDETKIIYLYVNHTTELPNDNELPYIDKMIKIYESIKDKKDTSSFLGYVYYFFSCWKEVMCGKSFEEIISFENKHYKECCKLYKGIRYENMIEYSRLRFYSLLYSFKGMFELNKRKIFNIINDIFENTSFKYKKFNNFLLDFYKKSFEVFLEVGDAEMYNQIFDKISELIKWSFENRGLTIKQMIYSNYTYLDYYICYVKYFYQISILLGKRLNLMSLNLTELEIRFIIDRLSIEEKSKYLGLLNNEKFSIGMVKSLIERIK